MSDAQESGTGMRRRTGEALAFTALVAVLWTLDTLSKRNTRAMTGYGLDDFRLVTEQATSAVAVLLLVPAVAWWLHRFPISRGDIVQKIAGHLLGSVVFAAAHYFLSVGMRAVVHAAVGSDYVFSDYWLMNVWVEYQKDVKIYVGIVAIIAVYRQFSARPAGTVDFSDRMVVQTGTGERIVRQADIECLESARNYVAVHTADRELLVRQTLTTLAERLEPAGFVRTHRSWLVNLDAIVGMRATDAGSWEVELRSGRKVPLSRSYRDTVRGAFKR